MIDVAGTPRSQGYQPADRISGMGRLFRNLAAILSLLVCLILISFWVRSYFYTDVLSRGYQIYFAMPQNVFYSSRGDLVWQRITKLRDSAGTPPRPVQPADWRWTSHSRAYADDQLQAMPGSTQCWLQDRGFRYSADTFTVSGSINPGVSRTVLGVPHWLVVGLAAFLPATWYRRASRDHRRYAVALARAGVFTFTSLCIAVNLFLYVNGGSQGSRDGSPMSVLTAILTSGLFAVLAGKAWTRLVHMMRWDSRDRHGLCPSCGYDLQGKPDRCPECGMTRAARDSAEASPAPAGLLQRTPRATL